MGSIYKESPCRECKAPKRHPGCHSECPDRAEWLEKYQAIKAEKDKQVKNDLVVGDFVTANQRKRRKIVGRNKWR